MSLAERFWQKVDIRGPEECWPWLGSRFGTRREYGQFSTTHSTTESAHRVAYRLAVGPIPEGLTIDHVRARGCVRKDCCNPAHLEPVTLAENIRRGGNAIKTHCKRGHPLEGTNLGHGENRGRPSRFCRACKRETHRLYRERRAAA